MSGLSVGEREAILRRALIRVQPEYFSWPLDVQERYRVSIPDEDDFRIRQAVLKTLFDIHVKTEKNLVAATEAFTFAQYLLYNSTLLPLMGVGADNFFLNIGFATNASILDFETLYDYDVDDYTFQEKARKEDFPDYKGGKPYRGSLYYTWARLEIDGAFHYASLCMAAGYLLSMIEETGYEKIDALIPHAYVKGKHHGKREGKGTIYDQRMDAGGMESQLDELRDRFHHYTTARYEALLDDFDAKASQVVYQCPRNWGNDPHIDFIFTDKTALQNVRFRHFMKDCRAIAGDGRDLDPLIEQERQAVLQYLGEAYQDIVTNFDPKLVKFRKRRKIIMSDGALHDLLTIGLTKGKGGEDEEER
jgi:hypothetical protein